MSSIVLRTTRWVAFLLPLTVAAQSLVYYQLTPPVIVPGSTSSILLKVLVSGTASKVTFESALQPGVEVNMTAGAYGIYSISLSAPPIVSAMQSSDVYRPFLGYVRPYNGTTPTERDNLFAEVADPQIPRLPVAVDASDVQHTDFVVNILMPQAFPAPSTPDVIPLPSVVTNRFYQMFPDSFDMINVVYVPAFIQNRLHYKVRNAVQGIGLNSFDVGAQYGSAAKLVGVTAFPSPDFFDGLEVGLQHEFGHQFINYLNISPLASGIPHWPFSTMASGVMGFSIPPTAEGGSFPCFILPNGAGIKLVSNPNQPVYSDLDLYLMGMLPPQQVPEQIVLGSQDTSFVLSQCTGNPYSGTFTRLHITDLTGNAAIGPRVPSSAAAQKHYRVATIVVTRDAMLSPDAMSFYSFFAKRMEAQVAGPIHVGLAKATGYPFAISTRGLGTMSARITPLPAPKRRDFAGTGRSGALIYDSPHGVAYTALSNGNATYQYVYEPFTPGFDTLRTGDFNGDGKTDLVVYNSHTAQAYIGFSNGNGTFAFNSLFWSPGYDFVEAGDLNGDGMTDFVLYNSSTGTLYTAISDGTGTFRYRYTLVGPGFTFVRLADFTGDGAADLFLYNKSDGATYVGIGDGAGGFLSFSPSFASAGYDLADIGDLNGDGKMDVILYNSSNGNAATGISDGSGGFAFTPMLFSRGFTSVRLADYTGDGKADATVYNKNNATAYFGTGNGAGNFTFQSLFWSAGYDSVEPQDVNNDGKSDILLYNSTTGTQYTGLSNANGTFTYTYTLWGPGKMLAR